MITINKLSFEEAMHLIQIRLSDDSQDIDWLNSLTVHSVEEFKILFFKKYRSTGWKQDRMIEILNLQMLPS